jgi:hypothetical protein
MERPALPARFAPRLGRTGRARRYAQPLGINLRGRRARLDPRTGVGPGAAATGVVVVRANLADQVGGRYLRSWRAMTTRWIWLVPS